MLGASELTTRSGMENALQSLIESELNIPCPTIFLILALRHTENVNIQAHSPKRSTESSNNAVDNTVNVPCYHDGISVLQDFILHGTD